MDQSLPLRTTQRATTSQRQITHPDIFAEEFDDIWPSHTSSSVRRYRSDAQVTDGRPKADAQAPGFGEMHEYLTHSTGKHAVPSRRTATGASLQPAGRRAEVDTEDFITPQQQQTEQRYLRPEPRRAHWLVYAGLVFMAMILGWTILSAIAHWWQVTDDDLRYGRPRTYQTNMVVGHDDANQPSHFIALNLNRHVEVIEFPGGDASKAKIYMGPVLVGPDQDLDPVTLTFKDVNNDHQVDMIVNVQDSHFAFINDNGQFRPQRPGENIQF